VSRRKCECEKPGYFNSGLRGVIAHVENGNLESLSGVERCDICKRYGSDSAAQSALLQYLGLQCCIQCGAVERKIEIGGIVLSNTLKHNRLCARCVNKLSASHHHC
jgi:hypothetical protein